MATAAQLGPGWRAGRRHHKTLIESSCRPERTLSRRGSLENRLRQTAYYLFAWRRAQLDRILPHFDRSLIDRFGLYACHSTSCSTGASIRGSSSPLVSKAKLWVSIASPSPPEWDCTASSGGTKSSNTSTTTAKEDASSTVVGWGSLATGGWI